ncbi:MAG: ABC transporter substrate-binding protein [Bryobacterales bacterium]|nr:ABC transporter substrate-binding protein [Bryobacterales bacterium]
MKTKLVALCILLVGCGGKADKTQVRFATIGTGIQVCCLPFYLAQGLGYFGEEGLEVSVDGLAGGAKAFQAMIGGSVDVAVVNYVHNIQIAAEGQRIREFFVLGRQASNVLVVAPKAARRIARVGDLKGGTIGVTSPGGSSHFWLNREMAIHGIAEPDFHVVGIGTAATAIAAVESGRVDAASVVGGDHFPLVKRLPEAKVLVDASTPEGLRESYGSEAYANGVLSAKQEWLDRNPETAHRVARAVSRAARWMAAHKAEEIREHLPRNCRTPDVEVDLQVLRWGLAGPSVDGRMPPGAPEALKKYLDATLETVRNAKIDLAATWTNEYLPEAK